MHPKTERTRYSAASPMAAVLVWTAATAAAPGALAQVTARGPVLTSPTQAVISYTAPDENTCTVAVREEGSNGLVHDVNPALFPNAHLDNRRGSSVQGRVRVFVVGKRTAEQAIGTTKRYSRALQADTSHNYTIDCGGGNVLSGKFRTANIRLGGAYLEPIPADPTKPGETAWPALSWQDRNEKIIDPQTGALIRRVSLPGDGPVTSPRLFASAAGGQHWVNPDKAIVNDNAAAVHAAVSQDPLFLEAGIASTFGGSHSFQVGRLIGIRLEVNGWCEGSGCASAAVDDRTISFCLTVDRLSCATDAVDAPLAVCAAPPCTGSSHRIQIGDSLSNQEYLPGWTADGYANPPFDHTSVYQRTGTVNRNGNQLTWVGGSRFDTLWRAGSKIEVNSQVYTIASVENESSLTLSGAPGNSESGVPFKASNFGVLAWKKTANGQTLALQSVTPTVQLSALSMAWDASGAIEGYTNCSPTPVAGPGGELGWRCHISDVIYWIGKDSGAVSPISYLLIPSRSGQDGWNSFFCGNAYIDKQDPNIVYCAWYNPALEDTIIVKAVYQGNNAPEPLTDPYHPIRECGAPPCWSFTNLTKPSENKTIRQQVTAFHPDFASFPNTGFQLLFPVGNSTRLMLRAFRDVTNNDNQAFYAIFDTASGAVIAAAPSWKYWPLRWGPVHGFYDTGDNNTVFTAPTYWRGPVTGNDPLAGNGPYYSRITSGPVSNVGEPCPARPADSPIAPEDWPTGDVCLTITVDGEPGDPTPAQYSAGVITTSGNTVTGSGVDWPKLASGFKMKIQDSYYVFTWVSSSTGTLSPTPPAVSGSPYILYREHVDRADKTGAARRDFAYLQDAEVRDLFCGSNTLTPAPFSTTGCSYPFATEHFRLIAKSGNTWTLERGYSKKGTRDVFLPLNANAYLSTVPTSCELTTYPCSVPAVYWDVVADPRGLGSGMFLPGGVANGTGHNVIRPTAEISAVALDGCPLVDGQGYSCYNARTGENLRAMLQSIENRIITGQPAFAGKLGIGVPNAVDSHPSLPGPLTQSSIKWFADGRPFNGGAGVAISPNQAATNVTGSLYKYPAAQITRLNRKLLPTLAACGNSPLVDVSGPGSLLTGNAADSYKYCVAEQNGECNTGSVKGDIFYNCPKVSTHYCRYPGPGVQDSDLRDVCFGDHAAYTNAIVQIGYGKSNMSGAYGRAVSKGLTRYRWTDVFWNVKTTPDGKWLINRVTWANGYGHEVVLIKLPPFGPLDNANRADFQPVEITVERSSNPAETHAVVEFGYGPELHCTSRAEVCVKGAPALYGFAHENVAGVPCTAGCRIPLPAIPQRVVYYRVVRRNAAGQRLAETPLMVTVAE